MAFGLDIKEVIAAARACLVDVMPDVEADYVRMEEIEREGGNWAITFSFPVPGRSNANSHLVGPRSPFGVGRVAKIVVVNSVTGDFVALRQRAA